jgi:hypothetical protein
MKRIIKIIAWCFLGTFFCCLGIVFIYLVILGISEKSVELWDIVGLLLLTIIAFAFGMGGIIKGTQENRKCQIPDYVNSEKTKMNMLKKYRNKVVPFSYDPTWVIELVEKQIPERTDTTDIIKSLKSCSTVVGFCNCGCGKLHFIDPTSNDWDFQEYITLMSGEKWWQSETITLTLLKDKRIGAIGISPT